MALADLFARAIDSVRARHSFTALAVAFSGGLDSAVLLRLTAGYCAARALPLYAFHVHHGLSPNADAWLTHCEAAAAHEEAAARAAAAGATGSAAAGWPGVTFAARRVSVAADGSGTEASARKARYAALGELCVEHGVQLLLTAHHADDQAETVLLQLLRGSGPAGLSGMDAFNLAPTLLHTNAIMIARPLLAASRAELEAYAEAQALAWVEDESNADTRYARNALRHQVMPALAAAFPGYQDRIARAAAHARASQHLLDDLAAQDLAACVAPADSVAEVAASVARDAASAAPGLICSRVRALSVERANNLLRHWFRLHGYAMPSTAWLDEMRSQALDAVDDAQLKVTHPQCEVRRHRGQLHLVARTSALPEQGVAFRWQGESALAFPTFGGTLHFDPAEQGLDPAWLRTAGLTLAARSGGERLKLAHNRPSRSLKQHYQALGVPTWERERAPLVQAGSRLLYAASIGMDCHHLTAHPGIILRWQPAR
ncbi:tRNA lysidine(34) synthetase TilS [Massilia arenosa]|uniref:tRNA(Ile)-lysidine synthase n=1 Tax=Zemynaea arenosa TaxID=2561931 RepID=A0A4Y9SHC9_9BURK|nr:tRNA lysidine(34) synthetase TilS [Massilia arenosa]TFW19809.1 tRNA lysidine(34) synthetase TilS [Massilia arenosa]